MVWVIFDCYGTLVDWIYSIKSVLLYLTGDWFSLKRFFDCEKQSLAEYRPYSSILVDCLKHVLRDYGVEYREEYGESLVSGFAKSPLFPDTIPGLYLLKRRGFKTAILSNTERRLISVTLQGLESYFDEVITAEDIKAYKPSREAFLRAYRVLGVEASEVVHVSAYPFYDLVPASKLGAETILVNRYGYTWSRTASSLEEVARLLLEEEN